MAIFDSVADMVWFLGFIAMMLEFFPTFSNDYLISARREEKDLRINNISGETLPDMAWNDAKAGFHCSATRRLSKFATVCPQV